MATMKLIMTSLLFLLISLTYTSSKTLPDKAKVGDLLPKAAFCDVDATCCLSNVCVPGEVVADREDCTWYYQCNQYGLWSNINCELEGTSFSCIAGMCQFEGGEECFDVSLCTTCPEDPPYYPGGTCNPGNCEEFEDGLTFPDSNDCHLFHICVQGFMITTPCNIGDAFDIYDLTCKPEITVDCSIRCLGLITSTEPPTPSTAYPDHCEVDATCCRSNVCVPGEVVADREDCTRYYQCNQYGLWSNIECELKETFFDCITGMCQFGGECFDESVCTTCPEDPPYYPGGTCNPGNCDELEDGLKFPDSNDCRLYHICVGEYMITTPCNIGDAFDIYDLTCKPEITVDCSIRCLAPITSTAPPADTSTDYPYPDHCHEMTACCRPTPCMQWYKVADSTNCSNYYECVDNMWFHYECYLDHLFDCERGCTDVIPACFPGGCDTPCE